MKTFVISDTHFNHAGIIRFCNRPFKDVDEMTEVLVSNWNNVVSDEDIVYHLGDVYFGSSSKADVILSRLEGKKHLILGNHDHGKCPVLNKHFETIEMWKQIGYFVLTHTPIHPDSWEIKNQDMINLYGHTHLLKMPGDNYINVCVENTNYAPVEIRKDG